MRSGGWGPQDGISGFIREGRGTEGNKGGGRKGETDRLIDTAFSSKKGHGGR